MKDNTEIAIVGRACRLPGAPSIARLWSLLAEGRCAVSSVPPDRWSLERFGHPRQNERGRSYSWAAGVIDNIWGFDAAAFGVSPREAEQMDPQQRLLLELTWEALEDAGLLPSSLAGSETGVYVGASTNDYSHTKLFDVAATDGYFATGNAASILANRISYIYDLNGPSFTVDTACSSSLVALDAAVQALQAGRIETAIVGGVSVLMAPFAFINFSQASMLSRTGLCQAFSAAADGYVRAEGAGVLVLRRNDAAMRDGGRVHARILASRVNSDGRTNGIALPSRKRQAQLLEQLYRTEAIDPDRLAFVEAHGTGTPVGDPVEAGAIGEVIGQRRTAPLPIGSVKSNIGHTEAAAGIAGVLKATLALDHDLLPASLHCAALNPSIDFDRLNLAVAQAPVPLPRGATPRLAGVSSYGFGGTNAHVVLADPLPALARPPGAPASVLTLSAHSRGALAALAGAYAERLEQGPEPAGVVAAAVHHHRERLEERLAVALEPVAGLPARLRAFAADPGASVEGLAAATVVGEAPKVAFAYSGNGSQWAGMGRLAYTADADFRTRFDEVDRLFEPLSGWSLAGALQSESLAADLAKTSVAQPLIFAIQAATTFALGRRGLRPDIVLGHSVGEVAAAEGAGIFDLQTAVRVIYYRSLHQESVFEAGGMTVLIGSAEAAATIADRVPGATVAAYNSPRAFTFSGPVEAIEAIGVMARGLKGRTQKLDIRYPFHSPLIAPIEQPLMASLGTLERRPETAVFVSTVTGDVLEAGALDARYWWRNIREPVQFAGAVEAAARHGARLFVEIGPSAILQSHMADTLAARDIAAATMAVLDRKKEAADPFGTALVNALAHGAAIDAPAVVGDDPGAAVALPGYPWQRKTARLVDTPESIGVLVPHGHHPLIGARYGNDDLEWHGQVDTALLPALADHVVDGHVLLPGAAFAEMALAVARDWLKAAVVSVVDFEIHQPLILMPGVAREVRCRVQPATGVLEIMSRPRLGAPAWQTHAVAKILRQAVEVERGAEGEDDGTGEVVTGATVYPLAAASGLAYGPAFQLLETARRAGPDTIRVTLRADGAAWPGMALDPARVDACFHGLALLYRELSVNDRLKPYVPVGADEIRLERPGVRIDHATVTIVRSDERTIVVDFVLTDAEHRTVATIRRARFQAMSAFGAAGRPIEHVAATTVLAAEPLAMPDAPPLGVDDIVAAAAAVDAGAGAEGLASAYVLMEGWATAVAYGLLEVLSDEGRVDVGTLVGDGRLPEHLAGWIRRLLLAAARSGLVTLGEDATAVLRPGVELPDPADILRALAADHPERSAELLLSARTGAIVDAIAAGRYEGARPVSLTALDGFELGGEAATASATLLGAILDGAAAQWPPDRMMRILQVGDGPLTAAAVRLAEGRGATLTLLETDRRRQERARLGFGRHEVIGFEGDVTALPAAGFDLVIASHAAERVLQDRAAFESLAGAMAPGAVLVALEAAGSVFRDVVFGLQMAMSAGDGVQPATEPATEAGWSQRLGEMGLVDVRVEVTRGTDLAWLCLGQKPVARPARATKGETLVIGRGGALEHIAEALATMLKFSGLKVTSRIGAAQEALDADAELPGTLVFLAGSPEDGTAAGRLTRRCLDIKALAAAIGSRKTTLWVVCPGATRADAPDNAVEAGVWAFCRTLANEVATLDVRLVDLAPGLNAEVAARRLRDAVLSETDESEIVLDEIGTRVVRFGRRSFADEGSADPDEAVLRLIKGDAAAGLDRLQWSAETRTAPAAGEVEIAVEAAGLNFRDVMWGLSILPEEILEDGFAGATLGLECAGRIVRVGPGVTEFAVGDPVLAFAKAALATHVTVPAAVVARRAPELEAEAAATVPVAFLTAYYGLIRCANLQEDEWVLIHGGAGGVGLAAMQIARWRGARIIATAGSPERRDLLTILGADHVFDSRSSRFVDDVRRVTGRGADVVLNSLSGEAMERSIAVLAPFGRFVELGKRDYVANTHIGLKPFRRNLSYFGVDLDQLMLKDDVAGRSLFGDVMALFEAGTLTALPYRVFAGTEVVEAFRVMQRSGHIGKIVIRPPARPAARPATGEALAISATGTHLVTGGLGGFGLETARWLVDHGARHLVLLGRSGAATDAALAAVGALRESGATVEALAIDVTDHAAMQRLFARFGESLPGLAGVVHAATVFDDALIATMSEAKLASVIGAKVTGADILDRLTRGSRLDYFLLFSSATTVIGNPGQGAYVAANAFLEGLARARRVAGEPATAIAWGAIEDVGVLTRSSVAAANLLQRSGVLGMVARHALDDFARVSGRIGTSPEAAVLAIAAINWSAAREHLPVLRSRSFASLMHGAEATEGGTKAKLDVKALVEEQGAPAAAKVIIETVIEEIARILRLPRADVSRTKPLMDIGLDSLMAVEFGMALEERFVIETALSTSVSGLSITELADTIVGGAGEAGAQDKTQSDLALRHLDAETRLNILDALPDIAQGAVEPR